MRCSKRRPTHEHAIIRKMEGRLFHEVLSGKNSLTVSAPFDHVPESLFGIQHWHDLSDLRLDAAVDDEPDHRVHVFGCAHDRPLDFDLLGHQAKKINVRRPARGDAVDHQRAAPADRLYRVLPRGLSNVADHRVDAPRQRFTRGEHMVRPELLCERAPLLVAGRYPYLEAGRPAQLDQLLILA
jgi:hypothetical protein